MKFFFLFIVFSLPIACFSQLNLKEIMSGPSFIGHLPENPFWSYDGSTIYFDWQQEKELGTSLYQYNCKTKMIKKLDTIQSAKIIGHDQFQSGFKLMYFEKEGALASLNKINGDVSLCYQGFESISTVQRLVDPNRIVFQQGLNLFEWEIKEGKSTFRLRTNFVLGEAKTKNKDSSFLDKQQEDLFVFFKDKNKKKEWDKLQGDFHLFPSPKVNYLGSGNLSSMQIDPSGNFVSVVMNTEAAQAETNVPVFITVNGKVVMNPARSKVSEMEPSQRLAILNLRSDSLKWVDFSGLSAIRKKPAYLDTLKSSQYEKDRTLFIHPLKFSKTSNLGLCDIRSADNKDRWIVLIDLDNASLKELEHQHDEAWIGGPGISSWNEEEAVLDWLEDGKSFYFQSEESGFSHLYSYDLVSGEKTALTSGNFEIQGAQLSIDKKRFYITANKTHLGNRDFYHLDIKSLLWTPILTEDGFHDVKVSPDEKSLLVRYSNSNTPWELYLASNTINTKMVRITHSTRPEFLAYSWRKPPVIQFTASDGIKVASRLYEPEPKKKNGAAVLFVHGAGYLQNAQMGLFAWRKGYPIQDN